MLVAVLAIVYSCNDSLNSDQELSTDMSEEEAYELLLKIVADREVKKKYQEVDMINGMDAADFFKDWDYSNKNTSQVCLDTPDCPKVTVTGVFNFNASCDLEYSYTLYNCGSGNVAIFDFELAPVAGSNCLAWDILVTQNYAQGDLDEYQKYYNFFVSLVLSDIEDALFNSIPSTVGQTLIASYIPNICAVKCQSNGAQEECGEECCIRFAVFNNSTGTRTTSVFGSLECGGTQAYHRSSRDLKDEEGRHPALSRRERHHGSG